MISITKFCCRFESSRKFVYLRHFATLPVPKGTRDLFQEDLAKHHRIVNATRTLSANYGYEEIATPIFEHRQIFEKSLGEDSDVVRKEMYSFSDPAKNELTLRPEGTAAVVRALLSNKLHTQLPRRFFYHGPMFRYESPQRGRSRQFHQIGVELFGLSHPSAEVELLSMASTLLQQLGLAATLEINSIADSETRSKYRTVLLDYLKSKGDSLSQESKARVARGSVLRVLDSKEESDQKIIQEAPMITDYYSPASRERFEEVESGLKSCGIEYVPNPRLVRGLDYYSHTIWEFVSNHPLLVGQRTLLAGGRYDDLVGLMRGKGEIPAIGWAAGIERMSIVMPSVYEPPTRGVAVIVVRDTDEDKFSGEKNSTSRFAQNLLHQLRKHFPVIYYPNGNTSKQLSRSIGHPLQPFAAVFVGEDELAKGKLTVKELDTSRMEEVTIADIGASLAKLRTTAPAAQAPIPKTATKSS